MNPLLVSIPYSPWSRRAMVALARAGVTYERHLYTPVLSEPWLRWRLGRRRGPVTVPVLLTDDGPLTDSLDIAWWASDHGVAIAPPPLRDAIAAWNARADEALWAGRVLTTRAVLTDPEALVASLPPAIRRLGPLGRVVGRDTCERLLRKYPDARDDLALTDVLSRYADALAEALDEGEPLLGQPSYADITAAAGLAFVSPDPGARVAPAARHCWTRPGLAARHADLLSWRDRVLG